MGIVIIARLALIDARINVLSVKVSAIEILIMKDSIKHKLIEIKRITSSYHHLDWKR